VLYPGFVRALRRGPATRLRLRPAPPGGTLARRQRRDPLAYSLAIRHVDGGSCNACESELLQLASAAYDLTRLGVTFASSPRHADLLLVTGVITEAMRPVIEETYAAMPEPRRVVALGGCPLRRVLEDQPGVVGRLEAVIPVDVRVPGCPPTPEAILEGILAAAARPVAVEARR
jgi:Ni,Fe-hydrogenase III small subunit